MSQKKIGLQNLIAISFLLLCGPECMQASENEASAKKEAYKKYFERQEVIYQGLLKLNIPGARRLNMDEVLAEQVLASSPEEIKMAISSIEQRVFFDNDKNIILHGMSGTGKSCMAQAMAIKCKIPCLFFSAGTISTEYMNSGVQNLNRIFEYAKIVEKAYGKPFIIIFDELEALTKKHAGKDNHENNILTSFWQEIDKSNNSKIVVIGTMNRIEDLPVQITNRTSMIEIPLPSRKQREAILSYHLKEVQNKYKLEYPALLNGYWLALETRGFSNRDLQNVVARATKPTILAPSLPGGVNKIAGGMSFVTAIRKIKKDPKRKLEREMGTWKHAFKAGCRDPKTLLTMAGLYLACAGIALTKEALGLQKISLGYQERGIGLQERGIGLQEKSVGYQERGIALQEKSIGIAREGVDTSKAAMKQSQEIADTQGSFERMAQQAIVNTSFLGMPILAPPIYVFIKGKQGAEYIVSKIKFW